MRCPQCEAPIDVLDACQDCIDAQGKNTIRNQDTTHCKAGHEFTAETTGYVSTDKEKRRYCLVCRRQRVNARRELDRNRQRAKRKIRV